MTMNRAITVLVLGICLSGCATSAPQYSRGYQGDFKHLHITFSVIPTSADSSVYLFTFINKSTEVIYLPTGYNYFSCYDSTVFLSNFISIGAVNTGDDFYASLGSVPRLASMEYEIDITRLLPGESVEIPIHAQSVYARYIKVMLSMAYNTSELTKVTTQSSSGFTTTNVSFWTVGFETFDLSFHYKNM